MEFRKSEVILEKTATRSFVVSLFSRMLQQQPNNPSDIIQLINETMEVADSGHSLSVAVAVDRAIRILLVTHWARSTFSSDVSAAYKLLLQHAKALPINNGNTAPHSPRNNTPGLDGSLYNFVIEKLIESFFLNSAVGAFITGKISRRPTDAVSFPSFHSAILACQLARDIAALSVKLYTAVHDRRMNSKILTDQLRAAARAMSSLGSTLMQSQTGTNTVSPQNNYSRSPDLSATAVLANNANVLQDCLAAFRPSKIVATVAKPDAPTIRPISSSRLQQQSDHDKSQQSQSDANKQSPQSAAEFTINILDTFFVLY